MSLVPRTPAPPAPDLQPSPPGGDLSEADWLLLFDAVGCRLRAISSSPGLAATVLPECIEALRWLHRVLDPRARPER